MLYMYHPREIIWPALTKMSRNVAIKVIFVLTIISKRDIKIKVIELVKAKKCYQNEK